MKIVVQHDGKQHVGRLLMALEGRGWLVRFYAGFAAEKLPAWLLRLPTLRHQLKKRQFDGIPPAKIRSVFVSALLTRFIRHHYGQARTVYPLFDRWVAFRLRRTPDFDLLIGYENANRWSFRRAKQLGKVTVLDLAQVHHRTIRAIGKRVRINTLTTAQTAFIDGRKQQALDHTDYVLTLSSFATESLTANGFPRHRIYEVNLGVDTDRFRPGHWQTEGPFTILFVGTISHRKGVEELLRAYRALCLPDAHLQLVGPVGDGADLLAAYAGWFTHVPFLHHDELVGYYQRADLFVLPSHLDSWGQVVLEAMACGTPVIVTTNTGAKDAVAQGGGWIIPVGDETALAQVIRYAYDHRDEGTRRGKQARCVAEQYTWQRYNEQLTAALTDIARKEGVAL